MGSHSDYSSVAHMAGSVALWAAAGTATTFVEGKKRFLNQAGWSHLIPSLILSDQPQHKGSWQPGEWPSLARLIGRDLNRKPGSGKVDAPQQVLLTLHAGQTKAPLLSWKPSSPGLGTPLWLEGMDEIPL